MFEQPCRAIIERIQETYPAGTRIKLLDMRDPALIGSTGTILGVTSMCDISICLDTGRHIRLIYGIDKFEKLATRTIYERGDKVLALISRNSTMKRVPAIIREIDIQSNTGIFYLVEYVYGEDHTKHTDWISETSIFEIANQNEEEITNLFSSEI